MTRETVARAAGLVKQLLARAPVIVAMAQRVPEPLGRDWLNLVAQAQAVSDETTYGDLMRIWDSFLEMAAKHGLLTPQSGEVH